MENATKDEAELKALSQALHELYDPVLQEAVPGHWLHGRRARRRLYALAAGCACVGIAAGFIAGWQLHASRAGVGPQAEVPAFVKRAAVAHAVYSPEVRHPVEVGADQETHLEAWLSKRLGARIECAKLEELGFALVGGRLLPGESGPVAQFMYQSAQGRRITLYIRTEATANRETAFRFSSEGNVRVFYWIDRKFGYALSSADVGRDELLKVANLVYRQLNP
jgi:anti-sigma factor RsiW